MANHKDTTAWEILSIYLRKVERLLPEVAESRAQADVAQMTRFLGKACAQVLGTTDPLARARFPAPPAEDAGDRKEPDANTRA